ncbi:HsdR family type I site-specific deoxyribonuclease, partial [Gracilibacillus halophilus YIM-C55.5]
MKEMLHGHDYQKFYSEKQTERMQAIVETVDVVLAMQEERKKDFLRLVTELSKAYALCATTEEAQEMNEEVGFFKSVKSVVVKLLPEEKQKKTAAQIDAHINQLISKSIISEEVVYLASK